MILAAQILATGGSVAGTAYGAPTVAFLASQLDAAAALIEEVGKTKVDSRTLSLILAKKLVSLTGYSDNYTVNCGGARLSLGFSGALLAGEATSGVGTPAAILAASNNLAGAGLLADAYAVYGSCIKPLPTPPPTSAIQISLNLCRWANIPASVCY